MAFSALLTCPSQKIVNLFADVKEIAAELNQARRGHKRKDLQGLHETLVAITSHIDNSTLVAVAFTAFLPASLARLYLGCTEHSSWSGPVDPVRLAMCTELGRVSPSSDQR